MKQNLRVQKLEEKHISEVAKIESELIGSVSYDSILKTISSETLNYFVLLDEENVCGFLECSIVVPEAEIFEIAIKKDCQGKGYSKILMNYFLNYSKKQGVETIMLEVNNINKVAINLYKKYNFSEYGIRKNYYGNSDAILMKLEI